MNVASVVYFTGMSKVDATLYGLRVEESDDGGRIGIRPQAGHVYGVISPTIESCARAAYWAMGHDRPFKSLLQPAISRKDIRLLKRDVQTILAENESYIASAPDGELLLCCTSGGSFSAFRGVKKHPDGTVTHDRNGKRYPLSAYDVAEDGVYMSAWEHIQVLQYYLSKVGYPPIGYIPDCAVLVSLTTHEAEDSLRLLVDYVNARSEEEELLVRVAGGIIDQEGNYRHAYSPFQQGITAKRG